MRPYLLSIMIALSAPVSSNELAETQRFINNLIENPPALEVMSQANDVASKERQPVGVGSQAWIDQLARQATGASKAKPIPQAQYFVSFSIPEDGLKRLILDADAFGIPSTIRGMVNNDMRDTANAVLRLVKEDKRGGVQIDPKAFSTYGINAVPALIVTCDGRYDRIAGNLALREALTKIAQSGDCANTARAILASNP
ncbi:type-F conjugative transfer system pilin assembly protein TrbC [Aeromonas salmonicida]